MELSLKNEAASEEVNKLSEVLKGHVEELDTQTQAWGEANREVGSAIEEAKAQSVEVVSQITTMSAGNAASTDAMVKSVEAWGESNRVVVSMMESANTQNEESKSLTDAAFTRLESSHSSALSMVHSWSESDKKCQSQIEDAMLQGSNLSNDITSKHEAFMESSVKALKETVKLQEDISSTTEAVNSISNLRETVDTHLSQTSDKIIQGLEGLVDNAKSNGAEVTHMVESEEKAIQAMIAPRAGILSTMDADKNAMEKQASTTSSEVRETISTQYAEVEKAVSMQKKHINSLSTDSQSLCNAIIVSTKEASEVAKAASEKGMEEMNDCLSRAESEVEEMNKKVVSGSEAHQEDISGTVASIAHFGTTVVKMDDDVENISAREEHAFDAALSETPSEEELNKAFAEEHGINYVESEVATEVTEEEEEAPVMQVQENPIEEEVPEPKVISTPVSKPKSTPATRTPVGGAKTRMAKPSAVPSKMATPSGGKTGMKLPTGATRGRTNTVA